MMQLMQGHPLSLRTSLPGRSEFPSLSGNSQPQYQNQSQAIWQRNVQQTPVQRPQQQQQPPPPPPIANQHIPQNQHTNQQRQDMPTVQSTEDIFGGSSHLQNSLDDFRPDTQATSQAIPLRQAQSSSIEDFPPLGRNGTNESEGDPLHPFEAFSPPASFSSQANVSQSRTTNAGVSGNQVNTALSSSALDRHISPGTFGCAFPSIVLGSSALIDME